MSAPLSIVIPTLNAERHLPATLHSLIEGVGQGLVKELVIADGGSTDATPRIAEDAGAVFVGGEPGRGQQLRRGADRADGTWLLFLHADSRLAPGWSESVGAHIEADTARPAYFRLAFDATEWQARLIAGWANARSRLFALPFGDQGLLIPRALYEEIGGYDAIPLMEDVVMARALRRHLVPLDTIVTTSAEKYRTNGWFRQGVRNLTTFALYSLGRSPEALARRYRRS